MYHLIYVMFQSGEITAGMILFLVGCGLLVLSCVAAIFLAVTSHGRKRRMDEKMKERYQ